VPGRRAHGRTSHCAAAAVISRSAHEPHPVAPISGCTRACAMRKPHRHCSGGLVIRAGEVSPPVARCANISVRCAWAAASREPARTSRHGRGVECGRALQLCGRVPSDFETDALHSISRRRNLSLHPGKEQSGVQTFAGAAAALASGGVPTGAPGGNYPSKPFGRNAPECLASALLRIPSRFAPTAPVTASQSLGLKEVLQRGSLCS